VSRWSSCSPMYYNEHCYAAAPHMCGFVRRLVTSRCSLVNHGQRLVPCCCHQKRSPQGYILVRYQTFLLSARTRVTCSYLI
jgi:hypothetical protein